MQAGYDPATCTHPVSAKKYMPGYEGLEFFPAALDDWLVSEGGAKGSVGRVAIFSHAVLHSALAHHPDEVNVAIFEKVRDGHAQLVWQAPFLVCCD